MKKRIVIGVAIAVVVIAVAFGLYFLVGFGKVKSEVRIVITPSTPRVNESATWIVYVTNGESSTMTIDSFTITAYKNDQLLGTLEVGPGDPGWVTGTVPARETVAIFRTSGVVGSHEVGNWKWELTCHTNFGDLQTTCTYTIST